MATITHFRWHEMEVEDRRNVTDNVIRNKIVLRTNERVTWTVLRMMQPVPRWNEEHPTERGFYLDHVKPTHKSKMVWELETEYTPIKGGQIDADPLARPVEIIYSSSLVEQPTLFDRKGRAIVNRAAEFIEGLVKQVPIVEYSFAKNLSKDPAWIQTHLGAVNSDTIKIRGLTWKPKTLLLSAVSGGAFVTENRSKYTPISGTILADPRTWTQEVWNKGTVQLKQVSRLIGDGFKDVYVQVPILEGSPAEPVSEPVPLDEEGLRIEEAIQKDEAEPLKKQKLITLKFDIQHEMPFAELPLK